MRSYYENNITNTKSELVRLERQINTNSLVRLAVIIGGGAVLFQVFQQNSIWLLLSSIITIVIVFMYLIRRQSHLEKSKEISQAFLRVNENEIQLLNHQENIYNDGLGHDNGSHPYVSDLDIFGPKSL